MVSLDLLLSPGLVVNGRDRCPSSSGLVSGFVWFLARLLLTSLCWIGHHRYMLPKAARSPGSKMTLYFVLCGALICILSVSLPLQLSAGSNQSSLFTAVLQEQKKVRWKETWIKRDLSDILANHVLSFGS